MFFISKKQIFTHLSLIVQEKWFLVNSVHDFVRLQWLELFNRLLVKNRQKLSMFNKVI